MKQCERGVDFIMLSLRKTPFWADFEARLSQVVVGGFFVLEVSDQVVCPVSMVDSCVHNAHNDFIDSQVVSKHHVETISHGSESH